VSDSGVLTRLYEAADREACLGVFDSNVPKYFTKDERDQFATFLDELPGPYLVLTDSDGVVGCGGYAVRADSGEADLCWGMVRRDAHGLGLGRLLTERRIDLAVGDPAVRAVTLNTSQHTRGFYEKLGFEVLSIQRDGYGPGLDRCDMRREVAGGA
jgi:ribosomal protein S18 acetylase RimI-like enzyme